MIIYAAKNLHFYPDEYARIDSKTVIDLPEHFSAFNLTKNQKYKKKININEKMKTIFQFHQHIFC